MAGDFVRIAPAPTTKHQTPQHQSIAALPGSTPNKENLMNRRQWIYRITCLLAVPALPFGWVVAASEKFPLSKRPEEWLQLLSPEAYRVLFEEDTERPGSSPLNQEKRAGTYLCAACNQPLFTAPKNTTAAPAGRVSGSPSPARSAPAPISRSSCRVPNTIARAAAAIRATSSTTARRRPASAIATTGWRCSFVPATELCRPSDHEYASFIG